MSLYSLSASLLFLAVDSTRYSVLGCLLLTLFSALFMDGWMNKWVVGRWVGGGVAG